MTAQISVGQTARVLQVGKAHALGMCHQAGAHGEASALVEDALKPFIRVRGFAPVRARGFLARLASAGRIHAEVSGIVVASVRPSAAISQPIQNCPMAKPAAITHQTIAGHWLGKSSSAAPMIPNIAATVMTPRGT